MTRKLNGHEYAQACIITDSNITKLISYHTTVISIDNKGWLTCYGLYSRTTIKHIGWFMRELGLSYYDAKQCYLDRMQMNVKTGEVRKLV